MPLDYTVKPTLGQRLRPMLQNWRLLTFVGFFFIVFGSLGYTIFSDVITHGVHYKGGVADVNLKALGQFPFDSQSGVLGNVPPEFRKLDGKKVALQGFMFAGKSAGAKTAQAQLVWNLQKCCFGGPPRVQERVFLTAPPGRTMTLYDGYTLVNITGTLHVKIDKDSEGTITSVYEMTPDEIAPAS